MISKHIFLIGLLNEPVFILFFFSQLNGFTVLFQAIQFRINNLLALSFKVHSLNVK